MQILVIGTGWLGGKIAEDLAREHTVLATFRTNPVCLENVVSFNFLPGEPLPICDVVILAFPPGQQRENYLENCLSIVATQNEQTRFIMCSSTSVVKTEHEAEKTSDSDSVLNVTEKELTVLLGGRLSIIRFGGLIGPDRLPVRSMLKKGSEINGTQVANVIHREDAVAVTAHVVQNGLWGEIFAAVAPEHPTKKEFYTSMSQANNLEIPIFTNTGTTNFMIHPEKLVARGFVFKYPSPLLFPELQL